MASEFPETIKSILNLRIEYALREFQQGLANNSIKLKNGKYSKQCTIWTLYHTADTEDWARIILRYVERKCNLLCEETERINKDIDADFKMVVFHKLHTNCESINLIITTTSASCNIATRP